MKRLAAILALAVLAQPAAAEFYIGAKAGYLKPNDDAVDATSAGSVTVGYELADVLVADVSFEGEYTQTLTDGDVDIGVNQTGNWKYHNYGLFAAIRGGGPIYLRARAGLVSQHPEVEGVKDDETGAAASLGLGFSLLGLETSLDWTRYADTGDLDAVDYLSLGLRF